MNPRHINKYQCSECGKEYLSFNTANNCCATPERIKELKNEIEQQLKDMNVPKSIESIEVYIKAMNTLEKLRYLYTNISDPDIKGQVYKEFKSLENLIKKYAENFIQQMCDKLNSEFKLGREIEVDGKIYKIQDSYSIFEDYFSNYPNICEAIAYEI